MTIGSQQLAERIAAHCEEKGIKPSTFGQNHFRNPRLYTRLLAGGALMMPTYNKLLDILEPAESETSPADSQNATAGNPAESGADAPQPEGAE